VVLLLPLLQPPPLVSPQCQHPDSLGLTLQLVALGFLIAGPAGETVLPGTQMIGLTLLWTAALLTLYTGWDYMRSGLKHVE
jgi:phosphatidylglycerophosphate synthase